jgi:hypothetical protein
VGQLTVRFPQWIATLYLILLRSPGALRTDLGQILRQVALAAQSLVGNLRATETAVVSLYGRYLANVDAQQLTFTIIDLTSGKVVAVEHRAVRGFPRADDSRVVESSLFQLQPT